MSFQSPGYLWLLLVIVPAVAMAFARHTPDGVVPSHLLYAGGRRRWSRRLLGRLCIVLAMGLLVLALANPGIGEKEGRGAAMLLLDLSGSMEARGVKEPGAEPVEANLTMDRLTEARLTAVGLMACLPDDEFGLVAFARRAYLVSPLTRERSILKKRIAEQEILEYEDGTAIGEALLCAAKALGHRSGDRRLYLLTDGADHSEPGSLQVALDVLKANGIAVYPIVVGTENIYHSVRDERGGVFWQPNGEKPDTAMLERLAGETGGRVWKPYDIPIPKLSDFVSPAGFRRDGARSGILNAQLCLAVCSLILAALLG